MEYDLPESALRWIRPGMQSQMGHVRFALFDFDGTISTLRQGWEAVMLPMMAEAICGNHPVSAEIEGEVNAYVDISTGILTIKQMEWLSQAVAKHGLNSKVKSPQEYKQIYLDRLMVQVEQRIERLESGHANPLDFSIHGAAAFISGLAKRGVRLYLASGTDHHFVLREAAALGLLDYFKGGVFGAIDNDETHAKDRVIQEILESNHLHGSELMVVGDGPVEMREAAMRGGVALGTATDEVNRHGWNESKVQRLINAGAALLIPDFGQADVLVEMFCG